MISRLYYIILYYIILYYIILYYTILYYTILYYTILYSKILTKQAAPSSSGDQAGRGSLSLESLGLRRVNFCTEGGSLKQPVYFGKFRLGLVETPDIKSSRPLRRTSLYVKACILSSFTRSLEPYMKPSRPFQKDLMQCLDCESRCKEL